jgi:hypothetical protein
MFHKDVLINLNNQMFQFFVHLMIIFDKIKQDILIVLLINQVLFHVYQLINDLIMMNEMINKMIQENQLMIQVQYHQQEIHEFYHKLHVVLQTNDEYQLNLKRKKQTN